MLNTDRLIKLVENDDIVEAQNCILQFADEIGIIEARRYLEQLKRQGLLDEDQFIELNVIEDQGPWNV